MSKLTLETPNTIVETTPPPQAKLGSKLLKVNPDTFELRQKIRDEAFDLARGIDRSRPLSRKELESHGRALLEKLNLPEGYLGFAMVMLGNGFWKDQFISIPFDKRILLLPHCLKHVEACAAHYDEFGLDCEKCGACAIGDFKKRAEQLGYKILIAEGTPIVLKIIVGGYIDGILGVACLNVLEKAFEKVVRSGVPAYAIPLHSSNCKSTTVDNDWVMEVLETYHDKPARQTRSYVPLLRDANAMFGDSFPVLLPRVRSKQLGETPQADDPLAGTEAIAHNWLATGGKRFRPFITLAAYDAMRGAPLSDPDHKRETLTGEDVTLSDSVRRVAMAMEAFHKASLVHDDIEDDDTFRYGAQTLHRRYGIATAINVGDYLLGLGYRLVASAELSCEAMTGILQKLADAHVKLSEGQGAELLWRDSRQVEKTIRPIDTLKIYALKTAPAFEASLYAGLRLAGPVEKYEDTIRNFSRHLGVAFQIVNDLKDWSGDLHNKRIAGQDTLAMRPTLLLALALEVASPSDRQELLSLLASESRNGNSVNRVGQIYESCHVFNKARKLVEKYRQRAEAVADEVEPEELRELLYFLVDTVLAEESTEPEIALGRNLVVLN